MDVMDYIYSFDKKLNKQTSKQQIDRYDFGCLTEEDFYPPVDNRILTSYVEDIEDGDNFMDYCEYIFELCDEEEYWD